VSQVQLETGQRIRLHLDSLASGGDAVGRHEGMAVFAMWGCPGDEAEVEITEVSRRFARGVVREVISPSPDRVAPPCPHFGDCGGCQLQHIAYEAQLRHKAAIVRDSLSRIGGLPDIEIAKTLGMDHPWRYRGRADYHAQLGPSGDLVLGFARHHTHDIVPLQECRIQHPLSERIRTAVLETMARAAQGAGERAALLQVESLVSFASGRGLATLVCDGQPPFLQSAAEALMDKIGDLAGVLFARKRGRGAPRRSPAEVITGEGHIVEQISGETYRVSPDAFFQSSPAQAARMLDVVQKWANVGKEDVVLDVYSGVGTFLLPLAAGAHQGFGIEAEPASLSDARTNLRSRRLGNVTLYHGKAERLLARFAERGQRADIVVLDPPRKGCGPIVLAHLAKLQPRRIVLVSCHPATLARDLKTLAEYGYLARRIQPVDMFPQTWHVEAVVLCERQSAAPG